MPVVTSRSYSSGTAWFRAWSRKGDPYDNAVAESFFKTLKVELVYRRRFRTRLEAKAAVVEYIELFYNSWRRHSSLGYLSPNDYEKQANAA